MTAGQPSRPANVENIVAINQGRLPLTMEEPAPAALDAGRVAELMAAGHMVVDTRSSADFGAGHVPGAFNIGLASPEFEQRVGWVVPEAPLLLVGAVDEDGARAAHKMGFVGLDSRVAGYLAGGMEAWRAAGNAAATIAQVTVAELHERLGAAGGTHGDGLQVLDVREPSEWRAGHIEGARTMSHKQLGRRLTELDLDPERDVVLICASGMRSSTAGSVLARHGFTRLYNVTGGMTAWAAAHLPMVDDEGCPVCRPGEEGA